MHRAHLGLALGAFVAIALVARHSAVPAEALCPALAQRPSEMQATALDAASSSVSPLPAPVAGHSIMLLRADHSGRYALR